MTYDKVQFSLNKHMYVQNGGIDQQQYPIEGEKVTASHVKQKRKVSGYESSLRDIKEVKERRNSENDSNKIKELTDDKLYVGNKLNTIGNQFSRGGEENGTIRTHSLESEAEMDQFPKYIEDKMSLSSKSRRSSCDAGKLENGIRSDSSERKSYSKSNASLESEREDVKVPKLDFTRENKNDRIKHVSSFVDKKLDKHNGLVKPHNGITTKFPNIKCEHILAGRDTSSFKTQNGADDIKNDSDKCMICEITEATAKYASVEENRLLLEIVYPHEFYDKFQRSGKRTRISRSQRNLDVGKESINICKPAGVAPKPWRRERTTVLPSQSITSNRPDPPNSVRETYRTKIRERSEQDLSPQKRMKRDKDEQTANKEIHLQCKAKDNALIVTEDSGGQKLVLKGLKGWILKKDDMCKNKMHKEIKKSLYQVNSLGMNFSIPEYNSSLTDRKLQFIRPVTSITSPRQSETQQPTRNSVTQSYSPRNHVTYSNPKRDIQSVPSRSINSLQRGYTHVPKLFSDSSTEDSFKSFHMTKAVTDNDKKLTENGDPFHKGTTQLSLPPLVNDLKTRSFTFTQF